ncbi:UNVERIFIED_CONTAM: 60S ribosomal protein L37 [Sesamum angustifolium]|uniref:60S ribosomal protein L37 n=2 Tax=Sesamum TaxID=4181 RepID=A0AAE2BRT8_9LAMI|nr:60S ribosomal protein L37 [Sesamum angolense]
MAPHNAALISSTHSTTKKLGFLQLDSHGKGNRKLWEEEKQDTHPVCEVRPPQLPPSEESLCRLCLSCCPQEDIKTTGTGRMRYLRHVPRRFKTNFREGTQAAPRKTAAAASA